jgi:hypothetical protein
VVDSGERLVDVVDLHGESVPGGSSGEALFPLRIGELQFDPVLVGDVSVLGSPVGGGERPALLEPQ